MKNHNLFLTPDYRYRLPESNFKKLILSLIILLSFVHVAAQNNINISGTVVDDQGEAVIGASVVAQKSKNGTITDVEGNFKLSVRSNDVLTISFIGYITQTVPVSGKNNIVVTLKENSMLLDEVVVTGFGLAQKKASVTGAISSVGAQELAHAKSVTATGALVGKLPGVNFRQDNGRPGAAPNIQIRNMGTPLIIIDGVQKDSGNLNNLDFNDIESVSVLKDASAAIYGMQAANGVVVITTKRGQKNQKLKVNVNGYYGWQLPSNYPKPASAEDYLAAIIQTETINGTPRTVTKEEYQKWVDRVDEDHTSFDWYKYIWVSAPQSYVNANVSGGTEKVRYYLSLGHIDQEGNIRGFNGFNRTNMQSNIDVDITNRFKIGVAINGRIETTDNPGLPGDDYNLPIYGAYNNLPTKKPYANNNPKYPAISAPWAQDSFGWMNYEHAGRYKDQWKVIQINGTAEYEILKGLKARGLFSYWLANRRQSNREYSYKFYEYDKENDVYNVVETGTARYTERSMEMKEELTSNIQLSYENTFALHHVNAVVGFEAKKGTYPRMYALGNPPANGIPYIDKTSLSTFTDGIGNPQTRMGYIGRLNYDYANKYIIELSGRYDGSYRYKRGKRWGFFPSASIGYRVTEEKFWQDVDFLKDNITNLKIRASYGVLGEELGTALSHIVGYNYNDGGAVIDGGLVTGSTVTGLATDNITWGKSKILNIGIDLGFLDNRLNASFDYFNRDQTGLLASRYDVQIPEEVGFSLPQENLNSNYARGFDASVNWRDRIGDVNYTVGGNVTYSRWYVGDRYKPRFSSEWQKFRYQAGNIKGRYTDIEFSLVSDGQFQSWEEIANHPIDQDHQGNITLKPGDAKYKDMNGDGLINDADWRAIGYRKGGTPWVNFAFNLALDWKGIDFRADFVGATAYTYVQQGFLRYFDSNKNLSQYLWDNSTRLVDIWDADSGFNIGKYPLALRTRNSSDCTHWPSDFWYTNMTYLKMRNVEVGYTLPQKWTSKVGISRCRFYVSGQNLFSLKNIDIDIDPEITAENGMAYPNMKVVNFGFSVDF